MTDTIHERDTGPFIVSIGRMCHGSETIARGLSYQAALELCESRMNLAGGNWKTPYATSNGHHFFQMGEYEEHIPEQAQYVFMGCMGYFGTEGTC